MRANTNDSNENLLGSHIESIESSTIWSLGTFVKIGRSGTLSSERRGKAGEAGCLLRCRNPISPHFAPTLSLTTQLGRRRSRASIQCYFVVPYCLAALPLIISGIAAQDSCIIYILKYEY